MRRAERLWPLVLICVLSALVDPLLVVREVRLARRVSRPSVDPGICAAWEDSRRGRPVRPGSGRCSVMPQNPIYEIVSGYMFPFVVLALFLWSVAVLWHNRRRVGSAPWAFAVLGAMFFASMPMVLTRGGAEGAHRSWGVQLHRDRGSVRHGLVFRAAFRFPRRHLRSPSVAQSFGRPGVRAVSRALCSPSWLSGARRWVSTSLTASRAARTSVTTHGRCRRRARRSPTWLATHAPVDTPVLADRYVSQQVGSIGRMSALRPSATFPIWDLYMSAAPLRPEVLKQIWRFQDPLLRGRLADGDHAPARGLLVCADRAGRRRYGPVSAIGSRPVQLSAVAAGCVRGGPVDRLRGQHRRLAFAQQPAAARSRRHERPRRSSGQLRRHRGDRTRGERRARSRPHPQQNTAVLPALWCSQKDRPNVPELIPELIAGATPDIVGPGGKPDLSVRCRRTGWPDSGCLHGRRSASRACLPRTGFNPTKDRCSPHLLIRSGGRVALRDRRDLAGAGAVVIRGLDAHRGRPRRVVGNPDRDDARLVCAGRSGYPLRQAKGPGSPPAASSSRRRRPQPPYLWVLRSVCRAGLHVPGCGSSCLRSSEVFVPRR